ncbi:MAG: hypothetical protein J2P24_10505 [Streptosporangiales bacterium]|nr:hypothetical protein [Streptosporangiales bacterium]MBO0890444.1 hypothetical protein [Acidothermales bacterium]
MWVRVPPGVRRLPWYGGPLVVVVFGAALALNLIVYWLTDNPCTLAQQAIIKTRIG